MIDRLIGIDQRLFLWLNSLHTSWLDPIMWVVSGKWIWLPLYTLILYLIIRHYKWQSLVILLGIAFMIVLSDQLSVYLKNTIMRLRPSHTPSLEHLVHTLHHYKGGRYGFVSSHATNSFALACLSSLVLKKQYCFFPWGIFIWAVVVSYSRIYLGAHYPADILGGALLGCLIAGVIYIMLKTVAKRIYKDKSRIQ